MFPNAYSLFLESSNSQRTDFHPPTNSQPDSSCVPIGSQSARSFSPPLHASRRHSRIKNANKPAGWLFINPKCHRKEGRCGLINLR
jgi:hypothetical protein